MDNSNELKDSTPESSSGYKPYLYTKDNSSAGGSGIFSSLINSKTLGLIALFVIIAAIPFTIFISQKQQEIRQRAAFQSCPVSSSLGRYYCDTNCREGDLPVSAKYSCSMAGETCCYSQPGITPPFGGGTTTPTPTIGSCGGGEVPAISYSTRQCIIFPDSCSVPAGWAKYPGLTEQQKQMLGCIRLSPTPTENITPNPSATLTPTVTPTITITPTVTLTVTITPTVTLNPSITATATTTGTTGGAKLAFTLKSQAIGNNQNPDPNHPTASENPDPKTSTRELKVEVFDGQNIRVANGTGNVIYDKGTGLFTGTVDVGDLATGNYSVKVKTDKYLRRLIGKETNQTIQHITAGLTPNPMPQSTLVIGDIKNDNHLNMDDYNVYYSCWGDRAGSSTCPDPSKVDLNDDGVTDSRINLKDYAWLFYSFEVQEGD